MKISLEKAFSAAVGKKLLVAAAMMFAPLSSADTLFGIYAGANLWQPEVNGEVGQQGNGLDFSGDFTGGDSDSLSIYLAVEHFVPLVPNLMLRTTPVNWSGVSNSASGTIGGFNLPANVAAELDIDMKDATAYYELLDNWVSLDLGLTLRRLEGFVEATETNGQAGTGREDVSSTIPMVYGHARFDLPFSGLAAGVRANAIGFKENTLLDVEAYLHLEVDLVPAVDFGIQGGLRRMSLEIDDLDTWNSNATLEAAYVGLTAHF